MKNSVAVIGGGISGLTALYYLRKAGTDATLFEKNNGVGGRIKTVHVDDVLVETGAGYFHKYYFGFINLAKELYISDKIKPSQEHVRMIKDDNIIDFSTKKFLFSGKLGIKDKLSLFKLFKEVKKYAETGRRSLEEFDKENTLNFLDVEEILRKDYRINFGEYIKEIVSPIMIDYFIEPFCKMTLFDPLDVVNKTCGMAVLIPSTTGLLRFDTGMETVTNMLYKDLSDRINLEEEVQEIKKDGQNYFVKTNNKEYYHDFLITTIPLQSLKGIFPENLTGIKYNKVKITVLKGKLKRKYDDGNLGYTLVKDTGHNIDVIHTYPKNVFKINSSSFKNPELGEFFSDYDIVRVQDWDMALPSLLPNAEYPSPVDETERFYLAGDFYLPCMEMSVQTGKKAAKRIIEYTK